MTNIYYAADSTVQLNNISTYPQTGIGQELIRYTAWDVRIINHAKNGRSTKSFLDEGRFEPIKNSITTGDFLFIQFGHNDEKEEDPERYTRPDVEYKDNLRYMIRTAKEAGANPVLITPIARRIFSSENCKDSNDMHVPYANAMKELANEEGIPCIDLFARTLEFVNEIGPEESKKYYMHLEPNIYPYHMEGLADNTHLKGLGAVKYAGFLAEELIKLGGIYKNLILDDLFVEPENWVLVPGIE